MSNFDIAWCRARPLAFSVAYRVFLFIMSSSEIEQAAFIIFCLLGIKSKGMTILDARAMLFIFVDVDDGLCFPSSLSRTIPFFELFCFCFFFFTVSLVRFSPRFSFLELLSLSVRVSLTGLLDNLFKVRAVAVRASIFVS